MKRGGGYLKDTNAVAQQQHYPWGWTIPGTSLLMFMWTEAPDPNSRSAHVDAFKLGKHVEVGETEEADKE